MDGKESINYYFTKLITLTKQMKTNSDKVTNQVIIEKILRILHLKFDYIVDDIKESKNLSKMSISES